jgi:hypothetical protein
MVELLDMAFFSEEQQKICRWKLEGQTYDQIMSLFTPLLPHAQIKTAIWRSVLGFRWEREQHAGPLNFLAAADEKELRKLCISAETIFQ